MAIYELKNDTVSVCVDSRGAELKSLKRADTGAEYMWCGDPAYWGRTSPILFPFVGGLKNGEYRTDGKTYSMTKHGFAKDMEFALISHTEKELWLRLVSDEETLQKYPFEFVLSLGYKLEGSRVTVFFRVENPGKKPLPFSIGGHPGFNCPIDAGAKQTECFLDFGEVNEVFSTRISDNGLALRETDRYELTEGKLPISEHLFDNDALVIENRQTDTVALCRKDGTRYVTVTMTAPLFGIWSPAGKQAPFVCIEPWNGRCDGEDFEGTLEEREWGNTVNPGEVWMSSYAIEV